MTERAPGTRRAQATALMGMGVILMLLVIVLSLGEVPFSDAARNVLLIAAVVALGAGLVLYGLARSTPP